MADKLNSVFFIPQVVPAEPEKIPQFLRDMQVQLQGAIQSLTEGRYEKKYVAPPKPRDGDMAYADGTYWNPGAGAGLYFYKISTWTKII